MNAKAEKAARKLYRELCTRNKVDPSLLTYKNYRKSLKDYGMYEEFIKQSKRYK